MFVARVLGTAVFIVGLLSGGLILYGAAGGRYAFGLVRTWIAFGSLSLVGLVLTSLASGLRGSERVTRAAGGALLGLGAVCVAALMLNKAEILHLSDTMQPWALLAVCAVVGGTLTFGSRA